MNYSKVNTIVGLLAASVFTQAGVAQTSGSQSSGSQAAGSQASGSQTSGSQTGGSQTGGSSMAVSAADKKFAMMVAQTDIAELQVSNMALQKSNNDDVKKLAQKLIDDHTKTTDSMKEIASKKGLTLPTETDAKHKALAAKLEGESGDQFDRDYIAANSMDHHKVVQAFQKEANSGKDPDIKGFASQYLPAIQEHTQMIDSSKGKMGGGSK